MSEDYGFVYLWFDKAYKRFYIGCHWGNINDGYVCSSSWMTKAYEKRPQDFKRRILSNNIQSRAETFAEEFRFLSRIKPEEVRVKYYNLHLGAKTHWSATPDARSIAKKSGDARKGVSLGKCSQEKALKISEAKKASFAKRKEETGSAFSQEHIEKLKTVTRPKYSDERKQEISKRSKEAWKSRERDVKPVKMTKAEQAKSTSVGLKARWADPVWAAAQREKLKVARNNRTPKY